MKLRLAAALGTAAALVSLLAGSGTAGAYVNEDNIVIGSVKFTDHHLGSVYGSYELSSTTYSTSAANLRWKVASGAPDTGYPNVQLRNDSSGRCIRAMSSSGVQMKSCNSQDPYQIWAMTQGALGTQFFNFAVRSCLDNGDNSPYLYHEEGCNRTNPYQSWYLVR